MLEVKTTIEKIDCKINWDNWKNENGSYWDVTEVLFCKLQWILEEEENLSDETIETLKQVHEIIGSLTKDLKGKF